MNIPYKYILFGVGFFVFFMLGLIKGEANIKAKWDAEKLLQTQLLNQANEKAKQIEREFQKKLNEAQNERIKTENLLQTARRSATSAERRLSDATADFKKRVSATADKTCAVAIATSTKLLTNCVGEYRKLAENADGHYADFKQCDDAFPVNK